MKSAQSNTSRRRIVIVGGGFGGAYCAQRLHRALRGLNADVILLDRNNYFVFYPLLLEAGTGSLEPRHAVVPIRAFLPHGEFRKAEVTAIDPAECTVHYRPADIAGTQTPDEVELHYDHLVLAPGSVTRLPSVPGLKTHAYQMKSLADAVALRDRAIQLLERANLVEDEERRRALLHLVVVGGNFTGVEAAGELEMFLRDASRQYPNVRENDCRVTLVELTDRILSALGNDLSDFAMRHLRQRNIDVRLETTVDEVHGDHVILSTGESLPTHTVLWCAGIEPAPLLPRTTLPADDRGYLLCERDLRVKGHESIWAIGDCAVNPDPDGNPYPATAQHAVRQGKHLADNLGRVLRGRDALPCDIVSQGSLAALGCRTGVARIGGFTLSGFPAWWLWRTIYLFKMPTFARKVRVALDWTMDLLFTRDYVELGVHRRSIAVEVGPDDPRSPTDDPSRGCNRSASEKDGASHGESAGSAVAGAPTS